MSRRLIPILMLILCVVTFAATALPVQAQEGVSAWTDIETNLRVGPGLRHTRIATLPANTPVIIEARNAQSDWMLVRTAEGIRGWGKARLFRLAQGVQLRAFPTSTELVAAAAPAGPGKAGDPSGPPSAENPPPAPSVSGTAPLNAAYVPRITGGLRAAMRAVLAKGRQLGNNPRVFSKVGDCLTDHWAFMKVFGWGQYNLGKYGYLQEVIDYFKVSPREGVGNSFDAQSYASHNGFNVAAVVDPMWSDKSACGAEERPLFCEYRLNKPSVAVIMFGTADVLVMTPRQFNGFLRFVVKETMDRGIVPILSTFPENPSVPERSRQINQLVVALAREKNIPLINLADALKQLPNNGLEADGIHLSMPPGDGAGSFTEDNLKYGYTLRNLLTLQALDAVWRGILN